MTAAGSAVQASTARPSRSVVVMYRAEMKCPASGRLRERPAWAHLQQQLLDALAPILIDRPHLDAMCAHREVTWQARGPHVRGRHGLHPGLLRCRRSRKQLCDKGVTNGLALHRHARRSPTYCVAHVGSWPAVEYVHHQLARRKLTRWYRGAGVVRAGPNCPSPASRRIVHHGAELARGLAGRRDEACRVARVLDGEDVIAVGTAVGTI